MEKKPDGFDPSSVQQAMKLAQSDTGRQLFTLLQNTHGAQLQSAMDSAAKGDYRQAMLAMQQLMSSPQAQELLKRLQED